MRGGRRPDPPSLKVIAGTDRADRMDRDVLRAPEGPVEPPAGMPAAALDIWRQYAPQAVAIGTLKPMDAASFGQWSVMTAHLMKVWELGEAAPSSYIAQWRCLGELFGTMGEKSRVIASGKAPGAANPFAQNGRRPAATNREES